MKNRKFYLASLLVLASFVPHSALLAQGGETLAAATLVIGEAWYIRDGKKVRVRPQTIFYQSDEIQTGKGKVHVQIGPEAVLQLAPYSYINLAQLYESGETRNLVVELKNGTVYNKLVKKLPSGSSYEIRSPTTTAGVRGTEFVMTEGQSTEKHEDSDIPPGVYVNDGKVAVASSSGSLDLSPGEQVRTDAAEMQKKKLEEFMQKKMEIFAHLDVMKEKNYKMLKEMKEKNKANIDEIKRRQQEMKENLWK